MVDVSGWLWLLGADGSFAYIHKLNNIKRTNSNLA